MKKSKKYSHLSTDQLKELEDKKRGGEVIQSKIKQGEYFVRFTLYRDIKHVYFHKEKPRDVTDQQCIEVFHLLKDGGYISKETTRTQTTVPLYKCLKTWNTQNPALPKLKTK